MQPGINVALLLLRSPNRKAGASVVMDNGSKPISSRFTLGIFRFAMLPISSHLSANKYSGLAQLLARNDKLPALLS